MRQLSEGGSDQPAELHERPFAGFYPDKSKGQNFLIQRRIAERVTGLAELGTNDDVIEIGPGRGILTEVILERGVHSLTAIELDTRLAAALKARWHGRAEVRVICADFLELHTLPTNGRIKVVANLPFNVASAILERLCAYRNRIARMVLMFQREAAERIRARAGERAYGALSLYTSLYWNIADHFRVSAGSFRPRPKVDAEVLAFTPREPAPFAPIDERLILRTIRAVFAAPRKTLRNSLAAGSRLPPSQAAELLERAEINPDARAATLTLNDILRLAKIFKTLGGGFKDSESSIVEAVSGHPADSALDHA